jgi:translation initiation factor 4G
VSLVPAEKEPSDGKKVYPRDFLLRFASHFVEKPPGLTCDLNVVVGGEGAAAGGKGKGAAVGAGDEWSRQGKSSRGRGVGGPPPGLNGATFSADPRDPRNNQFQRGGGGGAGGGGRGGREGRGGAARPPLRGGGFIEVKPLELSENRYVAASVAKKDVDAAEKLLRDCKAILNKLAPEKFEKLVVQFLELQVASRADMVGIIDLIFDKALAEPIFGQMYSTLCARCAESFPEFADETNPVGKPHTFKRLLLNKCQEEFEKENVVARELLALPENTPKEKKDYIRSQAKKRMLGNIRFIGELYKQKMLTEKIMHECLIKLLGDIEHPDEDEVECLCKLMSTVGSLIDHERAKSHMDEYFTRMSHMSNNADLPTRMRFMLQEIIDLRRGGWRQRVADPTVKVAAPPPQASGRPRVGAGDVRKEMQASAGKGSARGGAPWGKGGGSGPSEGRGRGGAGPSAPPAAPSMSPEAVEKKLQQEMDEFLEVGDVKELVTGLKELRENARLGKGDDSVGLMLIKRALPRVIEGRSDAPRKHLAASVGALHKAALLSPVELIGFLKEYLEFIEDEVVDIRDIGDRAAGFIAQAFADGVLPLSYLSSAFSHLKDSETESVSERHMVLSVLKQLGEEKARALYAASSGFDLVSLCGSKEEAAQLLESAGLAGLDPSLVQEVSAEKQAGDLAALNAKCDALIQSIKEHVEATITSNRGVPEPPARECANWVLEALESEAGAQPRVKKQVMRNILRCVFDNAAHNPQGLPSSKNIETELKRWRLLLLLQHTENQNRSSAHSAEEQAAMLFEVQGFCHDEGFPPDLIKKVRGERAPIPVCRARPQTHLAAPYP